MNLIELKPENTAEILDLIKITMPSMYEGALLSLDDGWVGRVMWGYRDDCGVLIACCGINNSKYISWFAVDPDHQRSGLGKQMLEFLIDKCEVGTLCAETYLKAEFAKANAFYLKNGFTLSGIELPETIYYRKDLK